MGAQTYEDLCQACESRGLCLELHATRKRHGEAGHDWRDLERLDVVSANGRQTTASCLIVPGLAGGIYAAAAVLLDRLTATAPGGGLVITSTCAATRPRSFRFPPRVLAEGHAAGL